jgi:hypothetical protein
MPILAGKGPLSTKVVFEPWEYADSRTMHQKLSRPVPLAGDPTCRSVWTAAATSTSVAPRNRAAPPRAGGASRSRVSGRQLIVPSSRVPRSVGSKQSGDRFTRSEARTPTVRLPVLSFVSGFLSGSEPDKAPPTPRIHIRWTDQYSA